MPSHALNKVKIDLCGPFPSGHYVLVVIDVYSRYPEIEILKSTAAPKVIPKLDIIFARHGIPEKFTTDNGPPFNGNGFKAYMNELGTQYDPSTPLWPQGNAVEVFQHTLQQLLHGIPGVCNLPDDILVFAPSYEEHNKALEACLQRLKENGLTLNLS